jgi:hypothetical protein
MNFVLCHISERYDAKRHSDLTFKNHFDNIKVNYSAYGTHNPFLSSVAASPFIDVFRLGTMINDLIFSLTITNFLLEAHLCQFQICLRISVRSYRRWGDRF